MPPLSDADRERDTVRDVANKLPEWQASARHNLYFALLPLNCAAISSWVSLLLYPSKSIGRNEPLRPCPEK